MTHLIASKTRLSPLKALSIPRVELMGAVIGLRLSRQVLTLDFGSEVRVESLNRSLHIGSARFTTTQTRISGVMFQLIRIQPTLEPEDSPYES